MAEYGEYIASEAYKAALKSRSSALRDVERYMRRCKLLSTKEPNAITFAKLHKETE